MEPQPAGPHASPRNAAIWAVLRTELQRLDGPMVVADIGGGTGGFAVPVAQAGHQVTVVDASPDALAALVRRAEEAGVADRIKAVQGDGDDLASVLAPASVDLVLCHSLLEVVDDPAEVTRAIQTVLRPGGAASVLVATAVAAVLSRAVVGQLRAALALVDGEREPVASGSRERVLRRFDLTTATALLCDGGLAVEQAHGVRVVADLVPGSIPDDEQQALLELELALCGRPGFRELATQLHLLARKAG